MKKISKMQIAVWALALLPVLAVAAFYQRLPAQIPHELVLRHQKPVDAVQRNSLDPHPPAGRTPFLRRRLPWGHQRIYPEHRRPLCCLFRAAARGCPCPHGVQLCVVPHRANNVTRYRALRRHVPGAVCFTPRTIARSSRRPAVVIRPPTWQPAYTTAPPPGAG